MPASAQTVSFIARTDYLTGEGSGSVALGDFNGDGGLDLAVVNSGYPSSLSVLLGNGDGTFQESAAELRPVESELVPQDVEERCIGRRLDAVADSVDGDLEIAGHQTPPNGARASDDVHVALIVGLSPDDSNPGAGRAHQPDTSRSNARLARSALTRSGALGLDEPTRG